MDEIKEAIVDSTDYTEEDVAHLHEWDIPDTFNFYRWVRNGGRSLERAAELSPIARGTFSANQPQEVINQIGDAREWDIPTDIEQRRLAINGRDVYHIITEDGDEIWTDGSLQPENLVDISDREGEWYNARWEDVDAERFAEDNTLERNTGMYNQQMSMIMPDGTRYAVGVCDNHIVHDLGMCEHSHIQSVVHEVSPVPREGVPFAELYRPFTDRGVSGRFTDEPDKITHEAETSQERSAITAFANGRELPGDIGIPPEPVVARVGTGEAPTIATANDSVDAVKFMKDVYID